MNFGRRPSACEAVERLLERVDRHPVGVDLDLLHVRLIGAERGHGAGVRGGLGDDHVAGVDERLAHQVDHLLAAGRHDHLGGVHRRLLGRHHLDDALDGGSHPFGRPILEGARRGVRRDDGHQLRVELRLERGRVGKAARQRDHVGLLGERHHLAHRRALHAARARSEQRLVARELVRGGPRATSVAAAAGSPHLPLAIFAAAPA